MLFFLLGRRAAGNLHWQVPYARKCLVSLVSLVGSALSNKEESKNIAALDNSLRRAVKVKLKEFKNVYEGEITGIKWKNFEFEISLRSCKGSTAVKLAKSMYDFTIEQELSVGDVVYIEPLCNVIKNIGRCENSFEFDIENGRKVPLPKKDVLRTRIVTQTLTLYDIDFAEDSAEIKTGHRNIELATRTKTNSLVDSCLGEIEMGILFVDDCHLMSKRAIFHLISKAEEGCCPLVLLSTSSEDFLKSQGTQDLLNGVMVIKMHTDPALSSDIIRRILNWQKILLRN